MNEDSPTSRIYREEIQHNGSSNLMLLVALGGMAGLMGPEFQRLDNWYDALHPVFFGTFLVHFATIIIGYISGRIRNNGNVIRRIRK